MTEGKIQAAAIEMVIAYITVPDLECARKIAHSAVRVRLAACANIVPAMISVYEWNGEIEEGSETILLLKTRKDIFAQLQAHVLAIHPYDTPCILEMPLGRINDGYASWLRSQVG
ncbi:divalent-cation tolerance protein CutA [Thalassospira marina]|uniref:Cation tolerance protein CutA n=1 Tax=Thalassospira marina TaxID=2048283 RepID=A0ABM6Q8U7_9PROT|nr:divalent-cation tolerance protein CutA [Thalassospira marina]AUG52947.1 cation tolerance protein CutA [Thalassospira marina]